MKSIENTSQIFELFKIYLPTIIVAATSYFVARLTLTTKKVELSSQTELKARELYFNAYQKDLEKTRENIQFIAKKIVSISVKLDKETDKNKRAKLLKLHLVQLKNEIEMNKSYYDDLFEEVGKELQGVKFHDRVVFVKEVMNTDVYQLSNEQCEEFLKKYSKASSTLSNLEEDLITNKRDQLFKKYIKDI